MTQTPQQRAAEAHKDLFKRDDRFGPSELSFTGELAKYWEIIGESLRLMSDPQWVYVPREPTREMRQAWNFHPKNNVSNSVFADIFYKAMIAAAPEKGKNP